MPTYRVYYAERRIEGGSSVSGLGQITRDPREVEAGHTETEWEEEVEARNPAEALDAFFREHVTDRKQVMWLDEEGQSHELQGLAEYDAEKTYIWIEGEKLMEYQGMDEATAGMVTCPLCGGEGEVDEELAAEFEAANEESEGWA